MKIGRVGPIRKIEIPAITQMDIDIGKVWNIVDGYLVCSGDNLRGAGSRFNYKKILRSELCVYCRENKATGLDHIHPRLLGGTDGWTNRAPACINCDMAKGHRSVLLYLNSRGKKSKRRRKKCSSSSDQNKTDLSPSL